MHTYIHTYIHTYTHTYIHTYMHAYIHTYRQTYIHTHTEIHTHNCTHKTDARLLQGWIRTELHHSEALTRQIQPCSFGPANHKKQPWRLGEVGTAWPKFDVLGPAKKKWILLVSLESTPHQNPKLRMSEAWLKIGPRLGSSRVALDI